MRFSERTGSRITTFVQGLAGVETGYRHGGFAGNSGFSLAAGGGVDISLKNWLTIYQTVGVCIGAALGAKAVSRSVQKNELF